MTRTPKKTTARTAPKAKAADRSITRGRKAAAPTKAKAAVKAARKPATNGAGARPRLTPTVKAEIEAAARRGEMPAPPDFSAKTHTRFRKKLAELVAMAEAGDVAGLRRAHINPCSTSPKAMARYRDWCVIALEARAASHA